MISKPRGKLHKRKTNTETNMNEEEKCSLSGTHIFLPEPDSKIHLFSFEEKVNKMGHNITFSLPSRHFIMMFFFGYLNRNNNRNNRLIDCFYSYITVCYNNFRLFPCLMANDGIVAKKGENHKRKSKNSIFSLGSF